MIGRIILDRVRNYNVSQLGQFPNLFEIVYTDREIVSELPFMADDSFICGDIIMPPYSIMQELVEDTVPLEFISNQYMEYLHTFEPISFIVGLIALILRGYDIIIDTGVDPGDSFELIPQVLREFFLLRYGIVVEIAGRQNFQFPVDPMYLDQIYSDLFLFDYADINVLKKYHSDHPFNNEVMNKIFRLGMREQFEMKNNGSIDNVDPFKFL